MKLKKIWDEIKFRIKFQIRYYKVRRLLLKKGIIKRVKFKDKTFVVFGDNFMKNLEEIYIDPKFIEFLGNRTNAELLSFIYAINIVDCPIERISFNFDYLTMVGQYLYEVSPLFWLALSDYLTKQIKKRKLKRPIKLKTILSK